MSTKEQKERVELEQIKIAENINTIKNRIVVFSGKGGVGKTTVSVNISFALQADGFKTGILDADITGPNVPKMAGINGVVHSLDSKIIPPESHGVKVISMASLVPSDKAVVWRGPMRSKMINEFLGNVNWGNIDYLVADLPPGTGDESLTIAQSMKPDMAIIVTTPQEVSLIDSARAISMAKELNIPHIALVENMSGLVCPHCGQKIDVFGSGGGKKQAEEFDIPFLGSIPINLEARKMADEGKPIVIENKDANISVEIFKIVKKIEAIFNKESTD